LQVTLCIAPPPFSSTKTDVLKDITGALETVNTVSFDLYGFEINGDLYDGSIMLSFFFSQEEIIILSIIKTAKPEKIYLVFRILIFIN
jgi:hypothetical protein